MRRNREAQRADHIFLRQALAETTTYVDFGMSRLYIALANLTFLIHVAFGLFCLSGWVIESLQVWYWLALGSWISSWIVLGFCPLTKIEFWLRNCGGDAIDTNEEVIHYYVKKYFGVDLPLMGIYWGGISAFIVLLLLSLRF